MPKDVQINMDASGSEEPSGSGEKKPRWESPAQTFDPNTMSLKQYQKKMQKKHRKESNRNVKRTDDLTDMLQNFSGLQEKDDYNFNDYFK